jgi:ATP-dependent Clp protease adaptor protein ClpS
MTKTTTLPAAPKTRPEEQTRHLPMYNVVLLDDDYHTFEYVITMLQQLFGYPREKGYQMALEVHTTGRVIVLTTSKEHAELKQEQIHAFGPDPLSSRECVGSMTAIIEPAY